MCKHVVRMRGIAGIDEIEILTQLIKVGEHLHRGNRHAEVGLGVEYRYEGRCESDLGSCMGLAESSIASDPPRSWTRVMQPHQRWRKSTISTGKAWLTGTRAPCAPMLGNPSDICKDDVRRPSVDGLKGQVTPTGRAGWTPLRRHFHPSSTGRGFFLRSQEIEHVNVF